MQPSPDLVRAVFLVPTDPTKSYYHCVKLSDEYGYDATNVDSADDRFDCYEAPFAPHYTSQQPQEITDEAEPDVGRIDVECCECYTN
jgi:hypothetical protein